MEVESVAVETIREGDRFIHDGLIQWTAIEDAEPLGADETSVRVQFSDGGIGDRIWDRGHTIGIVRAARAA